MVINIFVEKIYLQLSNQLFLISALIHIFVLFIDLRNNLNI